MKPDVSVIIPTTIGGLIHIARLMPGLAEEARQTNAEIIVVDNHSTDGTCNYLSNYQCTIVVNKVNEGFARAHNRAARKAEGDYLLLLNNDTVVQPGLINEMMNTFEVDPAIGVVGCLIYRMDSPKKVQHVGVMFTDDYVPYELGLEVPSVSPGIPLNDPRISSVREVPSVTAACMMVRREAWDAVGGFDEGYINGWEDTDLVLRMREKGYKSWYTGRTHVYHKHFGSVNAGRFAHEQANRERYDSIWVASGRAQKVLGDFRNG